jgi:hypothetical protein
MQYTIVFPVKIPPWLLVEWSTHRIKVIDLKES